MRKIERLKKEALEACMFRGHPMGRWKRTEYWRNLICVCETCGAQVVVDANPPANSIDICGDAVALNCPVG